MTIYALDGHRPDIATDTWIAPDANVIGKVVIESGSSVWFGCTLVDLLIWVRCHAMPRPEHSRNVLR